MLKIALLTLIVLIIFYYVRTKLRTMFGVYDIPRRSGPVHQEPDRNHKRKNSINADDIEDAKFKDVS